MKLATMCLNLYSKSRYTYSLCKSISSQHSVVRPFRNCPALVVCSTRFLGFHTTAITNAKSHQDRENEYAHSVLENIGTYKDTLVKLDITSKKLSPPSSSSKELSEFAETSSFEGGDDLEECDNLIFTYGTLKRGEPNHDLITDSDGQATFVGLARTIQKWPLVIASRYNIPYILYSEGVGKNVIGEVYRVDNTMLSHMDELECHPRYYTRIKAEVEIIQDSINVQQSTPLTLRPWIYFLQNFRPHLMDLPHLENYESKGAHGLEYVARYNRPKGEDYTYEVQIEETCDPEDIYS